MPTRPPSYREVVLARDVLAGRAAEAQAKAEQILAFAAPGGLQSDDVARVVDEQGGLPPTAEVLSPPLSTPNPSLIAGNEHLEPHRHYALAVDTPA
jgi:hypothetical protein